MDMRKPLPSTARRNQRGTFGHSLRRRIGALREERDALDEEVRQLRAAVQIYSEVVRRLEVAGSQRAA